jgi:hypothetical protein
MMDRLDQVEASIAALSKSLAELQARVSALERSRAGTATQPATLVDSAVSSASEAPPAPESSSLIPVLTALGRTLLVLGGAFLLRALTDTGALPQGVGVALGLVYAVVFIALSDRSGAKGSVLSASFHGVSAVLIAYPLLWETTTKLGLLSPDAGGAALALVTGMALLVAWRRHLHFLAWAFTLAAVVTILALYYGTRAMELYAALLLLLGAVTTWLGYGRKWHVMRWFVAIPTNALVLRLCFLVAHPEGPRPPYEHLSVSAVQILAVCLVVVYMGSFCYRTLARQRSVKFFEVVQSALALLAGYGGAVRIAQANGSAKALLGWSALAAAAACYPVAFAFVRQRIGRGRNFFYFAWLALIFVFLGSPIVVGKALLAPSWCLLAGASSLLGGHFDRVTLRIHSAVYLTAAAWFSGLLSTSFQVFAGPAKSAGSFPSAVGLMTLGVTVACYVVLVMTQMGRDVPALRRVPRLVLVSLAVMGVGSLAVILLIRVLGQAGGDSQMATVAVVRTGILALSAVALAITARGKHLAEMGWLVYPVLVIGGIKLLVEDLRHGSPTTLFLGFALFGVALIAAPRLRHPTQTKA